MDQQGDLFETYETYLSEHQLAVETLMNLEHVPRYIRLMELKNIIRQIQKSAIEIDQTARFLDVAHRKAKGKPY